MTVLIVEDNASVRRLLRRAIQSVATDVWECADGSWALPSYRDHRPDIVLMDVRLPILDGIAATRLIRNFDAAARIIIVTDCDDEETRVEASEAGSCGYALKQDLTSLEALMVQSVKT